MALKFFRFIPVVLGASVLFALVVSSALGAEPTAAQVQEILEQNRRLQEQVRTQQKTIDALGAQMNDVLRASERHEREISGLRERGDDRGSAPAPSGNRDQEIRISGEAGLAFFRTGSAGQYPNSEFRVDDAKVFIEAPLIKDVYFYGGLDLSLREINDEFFHLGEFYMDFENVSGHWGQNRLLNVRVGRINIPFGTEYLRRGVLNNPLISHSLTDPWGVDEGVEIYGSLGRAQYVLAVQNGSHPTMHDFNEDKSITARVGFEPARWLDVNVSAMSTGKIDAVADSLTELWFSNGFFRSIGSAASTRTFNVGLLQAEGTSRWKGGHFAATAGWVRYDDDDTSADNARRLRYFTLEGVQNLTEDFYAALRYSEIRARRGYPLVGWGSIGGFFFRNPPQLAKNLWRLSLGLGYRIGPSVVLKFEYSFEGGEMVSGASRDHQDLLSTELALKF